MKLSTDARKNLPASKFAGPGRSFPVEDKVHAAKAIQLAPRSVAAGNISEATAARIKAKARRVLSGQNLIARAAK